jgi:hypothetical protein
MKHEAACRILLETLGYDWPALTGDMTAELRFLRRSGRSRHGNLGRADARTEEEAWV